MNILILTYHDMGGGPYRLARAINENTPHRAIAARWDEEPWTQGGLYSPPESEVRELFAIADVVQMQNTIIWHIPTDLICSKPLIFYYRADDFKDHADEMKARAKAMGALESANFLDITAMYGINRWLPTVVEDFSHLKIPHIGFKVTQSVSLSTRYAAKNTQDVIDVMAQHPDLHFELITGLPWQAGLQRKGQCDAVIDQFVWGYGNAGVEAMSMGIPVLADARPDIIAEMEKRIGYIPFIRSTIEQLPENCARLRDDPLFYLHWSKLGRRYWQDFHSPAAVAVRAVGMFQETIDYWKGSR